jgi:hypothetical protein
MSFYQYYPAGGYNLTGSFTSQQQQQQPFPFPFNMQQQQQQQQQQQVIPAQSPAFPQVSQGERSSKLFFVPGSEIRRVRLSALDLSSREALLAKAKAVGNSDALNNAFWFQDEDGDWITCDSDLDFSEFLRCTSTLKVLKLKFRRDDIKKPLDEKETESSPLQPQVHQAEKEQAPIVDGDFVCDSCNHHIVGKRYHCLFDACDNYDLCEKCYKVRAAFHTIEHPFQEFNPSGKPNLSAKYASQLQMLKNMGVDDEERIIMLLEKANGNVSRVIEEYFNHH